MAASPPSYPSRGRTADRTALPPDRYLEGVSDMAQSDGRGSSLDDERDRTIDDADVRSATSRNEGLDDLVASSDTGGRSPAKPVAWLIALTALCWSLFQLWFASPFPFMLRAGVFNDTEARSIHLAFAIFLAFLVFPPSRTAFQLVLGIGIPFALGGLFMTGATGMLPSWYLPLVTAFVVGAVVAFLAQGSRPAQRLVPRHRRRLLRALPVSQLRGHRRPRRRAEPARLHGRHRRHHPAARGHAPLARPGADAGRDGVPRLRLPRALHALDHRAQGQLALRGHQPPVDHHRGRVRHRARRLHLVRVPVRAVRLAARQGGCRQLLHQRRLLADGAHARGAGEGRRGLLGDDRPDLGLLHRERRDHRHVHDPADEEGRVLRPRRPARSRSPPR